MPADDPSPGVARVLAAFSVTVPPVVFLALAYAGLSDPVFAVNRLVGHRLYAPLRRLGRGAYLLSNAVAFVALHFALAHVSGGAAHLFAGGCAATPRVLHDRTCLLLTGGGALALGAVTLADRVAIPLLGIGDEARGYARGWRARFFEAAAASVLWMALAEADATAVLLVSAQTARRWTGSCLALPAMSARTGGAFAIADRVATVSTRVYALFFKLIAFGHMGSLLLDTDGRCTAAQRRLSVGTLLALLGLS
jgi:hypothetical protein